MKCPKCDSESREGAKFCRECGHKLELACPRCGNMNPPGSKFCDRCGHDLTGVAEPIAKPLSFDDKLEKLQCYLPGGLTEKILAQRGKIEGEHRQVTVMFCDIEGYASLSEKLGEEKIYSIMDKLFNIIIHKVHEYGGTVNELTGDGIIALFGAPIAMEDAPQRAIRSALAIQREMAGFSNQLKAESGIPLIKMRIGIHTGPVVVGTLGNDLRVEFRAVGDTVNLASRMEGMAEPGTVYVTEDTFKLTEGFFRFEALGEKQVKGRGQPVKAYRVIGTSTRRTRFDVSAERGLTPFVGREKEFELLLDGLERAKAGKGQAFSIMGEAGVGKSRLLYEFRKAIGSEEVTFLEGKCLSYSQNVSFHPVIDLLKSNFNIKEGEEDNQIREKFEKGLKQLDVDEASTLSYLLELLGVKDSGVDKLSLSPEGRKERIIESVRRIVLKGSEISPLILAIEDLHWVDKRSEETLRYLLESIAGARILLIFTYRPEFVHTWGSRSYHSQITLNRLSNRESLFMVTHILGTEEVEAQLKELILEKTEGVPFFIEEFLKSLKDLGIIQKRDGAYCLTKDIGNVTIPGTIQDMIMARVDSLPDAARRVLQTGSAIEREFSHELIKRVTGLPEQELLSSLSLLKDSELLYERGIYPQSTYIFRHALTREVVYDSILVARKKRLHVDIGDAIEEIYRDNLEEHCEVLATHYITGENYEKGAEYCRLAARKTEDAGSLTDAIAYGKERVACLERLHPTEEVDKKIIDARTTLGLYYLQLSYLVEAKEAVEPIVRLALGRNYSRRVSHIYTIVGAYSHTVEEDYPAAFKYLGEALQLSEELNDFLSLFFSNFRLGWALADNCEFEKGLYHLERALEINVAANTLWGISRVKSNIAMRVYHYQGKVDLGYQTTGEALRMAEESGDTGSKALAYTSHGTLCFCKGFLDEAEAHLLKAIDFCDSINFFLWHASASSFLGETYFEKEEYQESQDCYNKAISVLKRGKVLPSFLNLYRIGLARAKVMSNEKDIDLKDIFESYRENRQKVCGGLMARYIGEILLNIDDQHLSEADDWVRKAIEEDERNGMRWELASAHALYAELLKRKGDLPGAKENLNKAIEIYKECGADGWLKKTQDDLAQIEKPGRKHSLQKKG
jgi:class 3 adenylate cyclase/tetratricopeptide (TPR) repeat protein/ABC-type lipoprotein export system ATPase subunit